jgi:hypothetical protein
MDDPRIEATFELPVAADPRPWERGSAGGATDDVRDRRYDHHLHEVTRVGESSVDLVSDLTLDAYQVMAAETDVEPRGADPVIALLGLAGEIGALIGEFKRQSADGLHYAGFEEAVVTELGDILWYLAALARRVDVPLSDVARQNLAKTRARWWPSHPAAFHSFDEMFPESERLPRICDVTFISFTDTDGHQKVRLTVADDGIGDPLDDNARYPDDYRYHDVFHLSYAAVLGWSPVLRALMRRKRKSDPETDRVEDGARARATEEAISAMVFQMSRSYEHFAGTKHVDESIHRAVAAMTPGLEVNARTSGDWDAAILRGFEIWRELKEKGSGVVRINLDARTIALIS